MDKLAIIIPAYKPNYLRETLDSIVSQTDKNFNLYIGDDDSPYDLYSIVEEYEDKISLVYKKFESNFGGADLVSQWERCIDMIHDESWIWLFSDDDIMSPNCVELFYKSLAKKPHFDVHHFDIKVIDENSRVIRQCKSYPETLACYPFYWKKLTWRLESYVIENIFSRKKFLNEGRFQNFDLAWGADTATWCKLISSSGMARIPDAYVFWRSSPFNISPKNEAPIVKRKLYALIEFLNWGEQYFEKVKTVKLFNFLIFIMRLYSFSPYLSKNNAKVIVEKYSESKRFPLIMRFTAQFAFQIFKLFRSR